jgi:hypothetical protein
MVSAVASTHFDAELEDLGKTAARLPEMRARRLAGTVEGVLQGKHR